MPGFPTGNMDPYAMFFMQKALVEEKPAGPKKICNKYDKVTKIRCKEFASKNQHRHKWTGDGIEILWTDYS